MNLNYRGVTYRPEVLKVPTTDSKYFIQFLGSKTAFKEIDFNQVALNESGLSYRGVTQSRQTPLKFLGKFYEAKRTVFIPESV